MCGKEGALVLEVLTSTDTRGAPGQALCGVGLTLNPPPTTLVHLESSVPSRDVRHFLHPEHKG